MQPHSTLLAGPLFIEQHVTARRAPAVGGCGACWRPWTVLSDYSSAGGDVHPQQAGPHWAGRRCAHAMLQICFDTASTGTPEHACAHHAGTVLAAAAMLLLPYGTGGLWAVPAELAAVSNADDDAEGTALQCMDAADEREDTAVRPALCGCPLSGASCLCCIPADHIHHAGSRAKMGGSPWWILI